MGGPTNTHTLQDRYSPLVDAKLRNTLVTKDNLIFNNRYEGNPKAGKVKIPVRDTEAEVSKYDRANGLSPKAGGTTYLDLDIDNDVAVNELIDGYEASAVPDGIVAERLAMPWRKSLTQPALKRWKLRKTPIFPQRKRLVQPPPLTKRHWPPNAQ